MTQAHNNNPQFATLWLAAGDGAVLHAEDAGDVAVLALDQAEADDAASTDGATLNGVPTATLRIYAQIETHSGWVH